MILVTGGAGFIGSNLVTALLGQGHEVCVLDDFSVGSMDNLPDDARVCAGSILHEDTLERLVLQAGLIYHLAAVVGVKYVLDDPLHAMLVNIQGTENVLRAAYRHGVRTVIASSSEIYGKSAAVPLHEDSDRLLGPTTANRWSYSASKAIDEYVALAYAKMGLPVSIVRYFNIYGPHMDPMGYGSVIAKFIECARQGVPLPVYDTGQQTRCFTYVADAVRGTMLASGTEGVFNIGSMEETSVLRLAQMVNKIVGSEAGVEHISSSHIYGANFEEPVRRVPDTTRAREVLGFEATTPLSEGLQRTLGGEQCMSRS